MTGPRVLGVIPVRGGSKGVPRKNLLPIGGKPLVAYTIETALAATKLTRLVVSTEDAEIAEVAKQFGAEVLARPPELALDTTPSLPVIQHVLEALEPADGRYDFVHTLQATSPLRSALDIDASIDLAVRSGAESVLGVVPTHHPARIKKIENDRLVDFFPERDGIRRQDRPPAYLRNGAIYVTRRDVIDRGSLRGTDQCPYQMPPERSVDIDTPLDVALAELLLARA